MIRWGDLLFGTTSYVIPDHLVPNVRLMAPFVDDIELILFEGEESNLPTPAEVAEVGRIARDGGCGFTVHLPLDVGIGEDDAAHRRRAQETCLRVIDLTRGLDPHAFVVHPELPLRYHPAFGERPAPLHDLPRDVFESWSEALGESLGRFARETARVPLAVENLQFPFEWVAPLLDAFDLGVTFDVGHLLTHGGSVGPHLDSFGSRLTVVHLHGIDQGRDHNEVGCFPTEELERMLDALDAAPTTRPAHRPGGERRVVVSLEVFGPDPTIASLRTLGSLLADARGRRHSAGADAIVAALAARS